MTCACATDNQYSFDRPMISAVPFSPCNSGDVFPMHKNLAAAVALALLPALGSPASAAMTEASARAIVAPFYDALNAAPGKDVASLITQDTSADWVSCSGNDTCLQR